MLEITIGESAKLLLERSELFNKNDIISFCVLFSYGKLSEAINKFSNKIKRFEEKVKGYDKVRIWYSGNDNENMNNVCFLIHNLNNFNIKIYLCNVMSDYCFDLCCYNEENIKTIINKTIILNEFEKNKYIELWDKLITENSDLRIVEKNTIRSCDFEYLDKQIIKIVQEKGITKYSKLILECISNRLCNYSSDFYFNERIEHLMKSNLLKIDRN